MTRATTPALLLLLLPVGALAAADSSPKDLASEAYYVHQENCGRERASRTGSATDQLKITAMWTDLSAGFDRTRKNHLLYWRALFEQCLQKRPEAEQDLREFLSRSTTDPTAAPMVKDSERRLRLLTQRRLQDEGRSRSSAVFGLAAGWQRAASWDDVSIAADVGIRTPKIVVIEIGARIQLSGLVRDGAGIVVDPPDVQVFPILTAGPIFVFDLPVRPVVGALFQLRFNRTGDEGLPAMPGAVAVAGLELPFSRKAPLALRVRAEVGFMERYFTVRALGGFTIGW